MYIHNAAASSCIYMQQTAAAVGVYIDNDNGNGDTGLYVQNDGSLGPAAYFYSNRDGGQNAPLCVVHADHTGFDSPVLKIINDGASDGLHIDNNGSSYAIYVDAEATATDSVWLEGANTTGDVVQITGSSLTNGSALKVYSNSSSTASRYVTHIINDNTAATYATCLWIQQDSIANALHVSKSGAAGNYVAKIESTYTGDGHNVMLVKGGANEADSKVFEVQDQNGNVDLVVLGTGRVGIGTASPNSALSVSGAFGGDTNFFSIYSTGTVLYRRFYFTNSELYFWNGTNNPYLSGTGAWTDASDEKIKKNIEDIDYGLETINTLKPRKFKHKANDVEDIGFIAQEVEKVVPEIVPSVGPDESAGKGLAYGRLTSILTKAVQELSAKNDALEAKVKALEDA